MEQAATHHRADVHPGRAADSQYAASHPLAETLDLRTVAMNFDMGVRSIARDRKNLIQSHLCISVPNRQGRDLLRRQQGEAIGGHAFGLDR